MKPEEIAQKLGVHYDGVQPGWLGTPDSWQFTDIAVTGSTFHAHNLEEARSKLDTMRRLFEMPSCKIKFTEQDIQRAAEALEIDPDNYPGLLEGMETEKEHADFTECDPVLTARIALAHLKETPDYYKKLKEAGL